MVQLSQNLTKISLVLITFPPQVRIFGVTVLVAAWWLDAAAKGIPPTIPFVNFNTVMRIVMMKWMDNMMMKRI